MNLEVIEGLTNEQIQEYYDKIIEDGDENMISSTGTLWYVNCTNGKQGNTIERNWRDFPVGWGSYSSGFAQWQVCGDAQYGYARVSQYMDDTKQGTFWELKCNNGNFGYTFEENWKSWYLGWGSYSSGFAQWQVCGSGRYGYAKIVAYYYD